MSTRQELEAALVKRPGERVVVLFDNYDGMVRFKDDDSIEIGAISALLSPEDGAMSCSLYTADWVGYTTTQRLDLELLLDAAIAAERAEPLTLGEYTARVVGRYDDAVAQRAAGRPGTLAAVRGVAVVTGSGVVMLMDGTREPRLSIGPGELVEAVAAGGGAVLVFPVQLDESSGSPVTFLATVLGETAVAGDDFAPLVDVEYTIEAGAVTTEVRVQLLLGAPAASEETWLRVVLHGVHGARVETGEADGFIAPAEGRGENGGPEEE